MRIMIKASVSPDEALWVIVMPIRYVEIILLSCNVRCMMIDLTEGAMSSGVGLKVQLRKGASFCLLYIFLYFVVKVGLPVVSVLI